jgi:hypothetical protein
VSPNLQKEAAQQFDHSINENNRCDQRRNFNAFMHKIQLGYTLPKSLETLLRGSVGIEPTRDDTRISSGIPKLLVTSVLKNS